MLKQLSLKLVTLMALVEASRTSDIAALDLRYRVYSPELLRFRYRPWLRKGQLGPSSSTVLRRISSGRVAVCIQVPEAVRGNNVWLQGQDSRSSRQSVSLICRPAPPCHVTTGCPLDIGHVGECGHQHSGVLSTLDEGCVYHSGREARSLYRKHTQNSGLEQGVHI